MNYDEIQKQVNDISNMLTQRGIRLHSCNLTIRSDEGSYLYIGVCEKIFNGSDSKVIKGDTPEEIFEKTKATVMAIPDKKDRNKQAFMAELASVIDKGKDLGIDVEFLNPLVEQMRSLSENIITDNREK